MDVKSNMTASPLPLNAGAARPVGDATAGLSTSKLWPDRDAVRSRTQMDALRFLAIYLIMLHHFDYMKRPVGTFGTHFFFVMTGFLVSSQLLKIREQLAAGQIKSHWRAAVQLIKRRWMRIVPLMWLMITTCIVLQMRGVADCAIWQYAFASNIYVSLHSAYPHYVAHLWWIASIEQTLPFIILLFLLAPKNWLTRLVACLLIIGPAFRMIGYYRGWNYVSMRVLPPAFIDIVGMGCLIAIAMRQKNERLLKLIVWLGMTIGIVIAVWATWVQSETSTAPSQSLVFDIGSTWFACALIILSYRGLRGPIGNFLATRFMGYLGALSYGMGMWHLVMWAVITKYIPDWNLLLQIVIATVMTFIMATCTYYAIELPVIRMKAKMPSSKAGKTPMPALSPAAMSGDESPFASGELAKS
jgi:peptidoglycan/LPS O-acetylase OafA/YrhL